MKLIAYFIACICFFSLFTSCQKELYFDYTEPSKGSLKANAYNDCLGDSVHGIYSKGLSLDGNYNYIDVLVNVTEVGAYLIKSDTVHGYSFFSDGVFYNTGIQSVRLKAFGIPSMAGVVDYFNIYYNDSHCMLGVQVRDSVATTNAIFTLNGDPNTCSGVTINPNAIFMQGQALNTINTVNLSVNVTTIGAYIIHTDTLNGVSFSGSGVLNTLGANTITLVGTGIPLNFGNYYFPVTAGSSQCGLSVVFEKPHLPAVYTINCSQNSVVSGIYTSEVPIDPSNYVTIYVNVTDTGTYNIVTDTINGISFSAAGIFTSIGNQPVRLFASGTPLNGSHASFNFYPYVNSSQVNCSFPVNVNGKYIECNMNGVPTHFNVDASAGFVNLGNPILSVDGALTTTINPSLHLQINTSGSIVSNFPYTINQSPTIVSCNYYDGSSMNWAAATIAGQTQTPAFTITISSLSATRCVGTFEGPVRNSNGDTIYISMGYFDVPVR